MDIHGYIGWGMGRMGDLLPGGEYRVWVTLIHPKSHPRGQAKEFSPLASHLVISMMDLPSTTIVLPSHSCHPLYSAYKECPKRTVALPRKHSDCQGGHKWYVLIVIYGPQEIDIRSMDTHLTSAPLLLASVPPIRPQFVKGELAYP